MERGGELYQSERTGDGENAHDEGQACRNEGAEGENQDYRGKGQCVSFTTFRVVLANRPNVVIEGRPTSDLDLVRGGPRDSLVRSMDRLTKGWNEVGGAAVPVCLDGGDEKCGVSVGTDQARVGCRQVRYHSSDVWLRPRTTGQ